VFDEAQLRGVLRNCASYYKQVRTHLSLGKHAPDFQRPQKIGRIAAIPILGGLHHQYVRVKVLTRHNCVQSELAIENEALEVSPSSTA
jgi:hypothetical protein